MLKENRIIFFILLVLLNIFIIYIICKNIKYYEEEFTQMIKVHYQEQPILTGQSDLENQSLYNFDFASDPLIINNDFVIQQLNNFIALFPVNDNICVALDNRQQVYLVTKDETNGMVMIELSVNGISGEEYPVKVVSHINDDGSYILYLLTSYSKIYEYYSLDSVKEFTYMQLDNAIDICSTRVMIYLNNRGEIKNGTMTEIEGMFFVQIVSYDNTSLANSTGKGLFGLCTDGHIYNIYDISKKTTTSIDFNIKLICNGDKIGYITYGNVMYYADVNDSTSRFDDQKKLYGVVDAIFIDNTHIICNKTDGNMYKYDYVNETRIETEPNVFTNNALLAGVSMNSIFVMSTVSTEIQLPPIGVVDSTTTGPSSIPVVGTTTTSNSICDVRNDDSSCDEIFTSLISIMNDDGQCD